MKKHLLVILSLLLALLLLAACGCAEHSDGDGDGLCDSCQSEISDGTAAVTTLPVTTLDPNMVLPEDAEIAARIAEALSTAYLGARLDIGLTAETAPYYRLDGEEGYVRLNADGTLEIIGIRARSTLLTIKTYDGRSVFQGFYSVGGRALAVAVREALAAEGRIASAAADAPASAIARLEALSLADALLTDPRELAAVSYMTSLRSLVLSRCPLGDLSYLDGLSSLEMLDLSYAASITCEDGGVGIVSVLSDLPALRRVSIVGAYSVLNRPIFDSLVTMTANGKIILEPLAGYEIGAGEVDAFAATVFFSVDELVTHLSRNGWRIVPGAGYSHAVIALSLADTEESGVLDVGSLTLLELYGKEGLAFGLPITASGDLTVNLYSYHLRATREENRSGIHAGGSLTVHAFSSCSVYGGGWDSQEITYLTPGAALSGTSVTVDTDRGGSLILRGGRGAVGRMGESDGKSPNDITTSKNGGEGGLGAPGIRATGTVTVLSPSIKVYGGQGGRGGDGADGSTTNLLLGGYDAGNGGRGGIGGSAVECGALLIDDTCFFDCLFGGAGGSGGSGGKGYLAGHSGTVGTAGNSGEYVAYK